MIDIGLAKAEKDLLGILELQKQNIPSNITESELTSQGFVTVVHDLDILKEMHANKPSIVARYNDEIIGYCLAMTKKFRNDIPVLKPMFEIMDSLYYNGKQISKYEYIISGQVCVARAFRGAGLLYKLYQHYRNIYSVTYDLILTEIATRNIRSIKAHYKVGFECLHQYTASDGEEWEIVVWNWNA